MEPLHHEWMLQQQRRNSMETCSLFTRLLALSCFLWLSRTLPSAVFLVAAMALFWLVEAIWKAEQARVTKRLLQLEQAIREQDSSVAMQFHSMWWQQRSGLVGLLTEYLKAALTPSVAVLYLLLILGSVARLLVHI